MKLGLKYPKIYADGDSEDENKFNCTQRGHQNTLETAPALMAMVGVIGLMHPITATVIGMLYNVARVVYFLGYKTGDASKRSPGAAVSFLANIATLVTLLVAGVRLSGFLPA